jgi:hypothetical protein
MCQAAESQDWNAQNRISTAVRNWQLEHFLFNAPQDQVPSLESGAFLPRHTGDLFIGSYFKLVHPQVPIFEYQEVAAEWEALWKTPFATTTDPAASLQRKQILFLVLAIGARVCPTLDQDGLKLSEAWANHFSQKVEIPLSAAEEPSIHHICVFLLKVRPISCFSVQSLLLVVHIRLTSLFIGHICTSWCTHERCVHVARLCCSCSCNVRSKSLIRPTPH